MEAKQFLLSKGIFDYQYVVDYDGESIELEKLLTDYAEALQLQQTGVVGCKCKRHCKQCSKKVSCDEDFCDNDCSYLYYR